jgi:hypothetical protein
VHGENWQPVRDPEALAALFRDTRMSAPLRDGLTATAEYRSDGTGTVRAYGEVFQRTWEVREPDRVCIGMRDQDACYLLEVDREAADRYRATNLATNEVVILTITSADDRVAVAESASSAGGAAKPSADEIAAKLANPNTPLATLTAKLQFRTFEGDLPGADDQNATTLLLQPSFPFPLGNGDLVLFRPAVPVLLDQPYFDGEQSRFRSKTGLGDITFDLAYARTLDNGLLLAAGLVSTIPTATDDRLGEDRWTLGPEFLIGKLSKKYVLGVFPNHQWDVGGSGDADVNLTTAQVFGTYLPRGGWNLGTSPIISYDHEADQWTVPLNFSIGKTAIWKGRPWKLSMEINYYVEQGDAFGPEWMIGFNIAPVVENGLTRLFQ